MKGESGVASPALGLSLTGGVLLGTVFKCGHRERESPECCQTRIRHLSNHLCPSWLSARTIPDSMENNQSIGKVHSIVFYQIRIRF